MVVPQKYVGFECFGCELRERRPPAVSRDHCLSAGECAPSAPRPCGHGILGGVFEVHDGECHRFREENPLPQTGIGYLDHYGDGAAE